jgi:hypothetical protein
MLIAWIIEAVAGVVVNNEGIATVTVILEK